jgi:hypothetical protein
MIEDFGFDWNRRWVLQGRGRFDAPARVRRPADYKSAIQQIGNLRYVSVFASLGTECVRL